MPLLNFQKQFAAQVSDGTKLQTIRKTRKHPIKRGDKLYLYTGLRTKNCRKLAEVVCTKVVDIEFWLSGAALINYELKTPEKNPAELEALAVADGFDDYNILITWFCHTHGLPFQGQIIHWS